MTAIIRLQWQVDSARLSPDPRCRQQLRHLAELLWAQRLLNDARRVPGAFLQHNRGCRHIKCSSDRGSASGAKTRAVLGLPMADIAGAGRSERRKLP
jgi:hypothetical protein